MKDVQNDEGNIIRKENEYGRIIAYERKRTNLSVKQLCNGICSSSYLQRIERLRLINDEKKKSSYIYRYNNSYSSKY